MKVVHTEGLKSICGETLRLIEETDYMNRQTPHNCSVIGPTGSDFANVAKRSIPFCEFDFFDFDYHPANFIKAYQLLKHIRPDVVHTHNSKDAWVFGVAARVLGIPIVRGRHITLPFKKSRFANFVYTRLADAFTVNCEAIRKLLLDANLARPDQIFITPPGINFERFNVNKIERNFLKKELGLSHDSFMIGTACILRDWKGVDTLIKAFLKVYKDTGEKRFYLAIAGKGSEEKKLMELAKPCSGRIFFLGFRDDIERVIGGMDLFILASKRSEATSQTIPQAMALKVPVIGTEAGGIPDIIKHKKTGWLVSVDDVEGLAKKIIEVYRLEKGEIDFITGNAFKFITGEFTVEKTVSRYIDAYNMVIGKGNKRRT